MITTHYGEHINGLNQTYEAALAQVNADGAGIEAVLIHSGSEAHYFADDRAIQFQAFGHFLHWLPVNRPDQLVCFSPGQKPIYYQVVPDDFWYDQSIEVADWWMNQFHIIRLGSVTELRKHLPDATISYLGENIELARALEIDPARVNPSALISYLDYHRAYKSEYELDQLRSANQLALKGHAAAKESFVAGGNEYDIHMAYLNACEILEEESPYTNIVALDEKSAILHYQYKRKGPAEKSQVLLIDAGCRVNGYGSDITRTTTKETVAPVFQSLLNGMDILQQQLVAELKPGKPYQEVHATAMQGVADLLVEHGICNGKADEMLALEVPQLFMPHGVGHLLGLQVHDVGGHQQDIDGSSLAPPTTSPALRNTRIMEENMVFTIEPGIYFIPLLLEPERDKTNRNLFNWELIDELYPCGGMRIEDNVVITADGVENLTRS